MNLVVKVSNDEGDGSKFESLRRENQILRIFAGAEEQSNIVQLVDYFEDSRNENLNYLVLKNAGDMSLQDLVEESTENDEIISPQVS